MKIYRFISAALIIWGVLLIAFDNKNPNTFLIGISFIVGPIIVMSIVAIVAEWFRKK